MARTAHQSFPPRLLSHVPLSAYMQRLASSRPRFGNWLLIAVAAGIVLALVVFTIGNLIF
jgi:hypothetical protein